MTNVTKITPEQAQMIIAQKAVVDQVNAEYALMVRVALAGNVDEDEISHLVVRSDGTVEYSVPADMVESLRAVDGAGG